MTERKHEWGPDVEELTRFARWAASGQTPRLNKALADAQSEFPTFTTEDQRLVVVEHKDGSSHSYKYITLGKVIETAGPILARHGLSFRSMPGYGDPGDGKVGQVLRYTLAHESGEQVDGVFPLSAGDKGIQGYGSSITYARRYCLAAILNLAVEQDDDGMAAMLNAENEPAGVRARTSGKGSARAKPAPQRAVTTAADALPGGDPAADVDAVTAHRRMLNLMFKRLTEAGVAQDRDGRLTWMSTFTNRAVASSNDLTRDEVKAIIAWAETTPDSPNDGDQLVAEAT